MKLLLRNLILVMALLMGGSAFAQVKIATVDLGRVFTNYWRTKQGQVAIDAQRSDIEKRGKDLLANFNKAKQEYQDLLNSVNDAAASAEEKDKRKRAAEDKLQDLKMQQEDIQQFDRGQSAALEEQIKRTRDNIVADIRTVVSAKAKADGYTLVIDTAAQSVNATPVVLYSVPGDNDITEAVVKQLNINAPLDMPKADDGMKTNSSSPPKK
jgi:outer membrane protein